MKREVNMDVEQKRLALSARELSDRFGVSLRHVRRMDSAGLLSAPIRLGRSVRWPADEIEAWMKAGAPDRRRWGEIRGRQNGRVGQ